MPFKKHIVAALAALALGSGVHATPLIGAGDISFGENGTPGQTVTGAPVAARAAFFGKLVSGVSSYGFEGDDDRTLGGSGITVAFNDGINAPIINAQLTGTGEATNQVDSGRFNTTPLGDTYLAINSGSQFVLSFGTSAVAAFGFYGTDIGDFAGSLSVFLRHAGSAEEDEFDVRSGATNQASNGALLFWGFASVNAAYDQVRFVTTGSTSITDVFGFDDFVVADVSQIRRVSPPGVPEPASLALVGLALVGAAAARRRG